MGLMENAVLLLSVAGGTDVNHFIHEHDKRDVMEDMVRQSQKVICLS